ncbi:hypothetical protein F8M41_024358 [Gigaspora margarita]|uniref:Uncharacterized protein n=1 Tax=Gigaspora margarita TaxID=4874 RepID=A0A8H4ABK4_GIGMA|nr:hypothetical protein F8M41_024358 [Gigaspora margarita]
MSNNPNNFSTLPKSNKSKSQKVDIDDQSALTNLVITSLINNVVERASKSSTQISSSNNNNMSELQDKTESELQELEPALDSQEFGLESLKQLESYWKRFRG